MLQLDDAKAATRALWALGDYHRFATATIWGLGPELVAACGVGPGMHVLDVAAGSGNAAIRAAEAGATVVASDLTPENLDAGRRTANARGLRLEWVEADAEDLPFEDDRFDVVLSLFGAIFAPDHEAVADELLRVCRPGGTIGMLVFAPDGLAAEFFGLFDAYAPAARAPLAWGDEHHVRELFGDRVASLALTPGSYVERSPAGPAAYVDLFKATFGPVVGLYASLPPEQVAALDRAFLDFATRADTGRPGGPAEYRYDTALIVARKP